MRMRMAYSDMLKAELVELLEQRDAEIQRLRGEIEEQRKRYESEIKRLYQPGALGYEKVKAEIEQLSREVAACAEKMRRVQDLPLPEEPDKRVLLVHYSNSIQALKDRIKQLEGKIAVEERG